MALERPIFWLGVGGLSPSQRAALLSFLPSQPSSLPAWRLAKFDEADAWCVSGAAAQLEDDGVLVVPDSRRTEPPLQLQLEAVDRPLAFTVPLASPEIEPLATVDPDSERTVLMLLKKFETWLQPLRAQYFLGAWFYQAHGALLQAVYAVEHQSVLLAVVDVPRRRIDFRVDASPVQLEQARWRKVASSDADPPPRFKREGLVQVMWQFAQHSAADLLPVGYRTELIRLLRRPRVPASWLKESQRTVLRALEAGPSSFVQLEKSGLNPEQLARDLASFYFDGAISTAAGDMPWMPSANAHLSGRGLLF